jgi:hypothetical protein
VRRIALALIVLSALSGAAFVATGCGHGSTAPEAAIEKADKHVEQLEGELMLAEVEVEKAFLEEDEREAVKEPRRAARGISGILRSAHKIERECREGDGLESCTELDSIEAVVREIEQNARVGPTRGG